MNRGRVLDDEARRIARELRDRGLSLRQIAEGTGLSKSSARRAALEPRPRAEPAAAPLSLRDEIVAYAADGTAVPLDLHTERQDPPVTRGRAYLTSAMRGGADGLCVSAVLPDPELARKYHELVRAAAREGNLIAVPGPFPGTWTVHAKGCPGEKVPEECPAVRAA